MELGNANPLSQPGNRTSAEANCPELSVVIPCYNEEEVLSELYARVSAVCCDCADHWELVLIDDGSQDRTWEILKQLSDDDPCVVAVKLSRNFGQHSALMAGLSVSRGAEVLILDADLQDPPELLPNMRRILSEQKVDVVYGQRKSRAGESIFKRLTAWMFYRIMGWLSDVPIPRDTGLFRLMRRNVVDSVLKHSGNTRFLRGVFAWVGYRQAAMPYNREDRAAGTSKWPIRKMTGLALDGIATFSTAPLQLPFLGCIGFVMLGSLSLMVFLIQSTLQDSVPGAWMVSTLLCLIAAVHFLSMGVLALYLGKISRQSSGHPLYIVAEVARPPRVCPSFTYEGDSYESPLTTSERVYPH